MRVAIISPFPPEPCGIGTYAQQQAWAYESQGAEVRRLDVARLRRSGWADSVLEEWAEELRAADRIVLHYERGQFQAPAPRWALGMWRGHGILGRLLRPHSVKVEVVMHEPPDRPLAGLAAILARGSARRLLGAASQLVFHTAVEVETFRASVRLRTPVRVEPHHRHFRPFATYTKAQARRVLGIPQQEAMLLAIGFYHPLKGFERAARAFHAVASSIPRARLRIVTSVREGRYSLTALREMATGHVELREGYVSDEAFDTWLQACDALVVPYVSSATSSVLGRATLFRVPCIVSAVGGLGEQAPPGSTMVRDDKELAAAMALHGGNHARQEPARDSPAAAHSATLTS